MKCPWLLHLESLTRDVNGLSGRVNNLESRVSSLEARPPSVDQLAGASGGEGSGSHAPSRDSAPRLGARPASASMPPGAAPSGDRVAPAFTALRIEIVNCHEYARRFEQALDEVECTQFLRALVNALPENVQQCLLPFREQQRRNSRALVFVPCLHVKPNLTHDMRQDLIERLRAPLETGAHDRHGRRPRARWEPGPQQRPMSRLLAHGHRLTERIHEAHPELANWKVQSAGKSVEVWLCRPLTHPTLAARFDESHTLTFVAEELGPLTGDVVRELWSQVIAS